MRNNERKNKGKDEELIKIRITKDYIEEEEPTKKKKKKLEGVVSPEGNYNGLKRREL
jgi:hypothetical protein